MSLASLGTIEGETIIFFIMGKQKNKKKSPPLPQSLKEMIMTLKTYNSTLT